MLLRELEPAIPTTPIVEKCSGGRLGVADEHRIRKKLSERLESLSCWTEFDPNNFFVEENQLRTQADYIQNLVLHLPEIYGETFRLGNHVRQALDQKGFTDFCLADLLVGLEHAAHHTSYCRHALEILSDELNWIPSQFTGACTDRR